MTSEINDGSTQCNRIHINCRAMNLRYTRNETRLRKLVATFLFKSLVDLARVENSVFRR